MSTRMTGSESTRSGAGLGTFAGVFTPSILTILGIILFLRSGFVVGNAGLGGTIAIIAIATAVSVLTSISLSAIATNIEVGGGGDYYLISRTLGIEFGGAIGIVLFVAQSVSVGFYAIGFGEVTASLLGWESGLAVRAIAATAVALLFIFAWAGADVATRLQFVVMTFLVVALASFYLGAVGEFDSSTLGNAWSSVPGSIGFWAAFAIFFPAVTGFTQGVSMSGDLANPSKSLPGGTFTAVGVSTVVYLSVVFLIAGGVPIGALLNDDGTAMRELAAVGALVTLGVVAATLSSAMASFLGAPRILQAMAADRVYPLIGTFAKGHGPQNNPRRAVLLTLAIALATLLLGSVNAVARIVSMFFLISYGLLNYATYYEARASSPSFRPRFRFFNKQASLAGAVLCGGAMLAINPVAGGISIVLLLAIYWYLARRTVPRPWADASHSYHFQRAIESVKAMEGESDHARHWRPQLLVFSADRSRRSRLVTFAKWIEGNSGFTAVFRIVIGSGIRKRIEADEEQEALQQEISDLGLDVLSRTVLAPEGLQALPVIVQSFGIGRLQSNVVLFGWPEAPDPSRMGGYINAIRGVARLGVSTMSLSTDEGRWQRLADTPARQRTIDVWWEDNDSGRLALMSAYLCTRNADWRHATVRLIASGVEDPEATRAELERMLDASRIPATVITFGSVDRQRVIETSSDASLVLMPMHLRREALVDAMGLDIVGLAAELPMTAAVHAGEPIHLETDPSTGIAEQVAAATDEVAQAAERLKRLEQNLAAAGTKADTLRTTGASSDDIEEADYELERTHRRTLSARARLERAQADLDQLTGTR